MGKAIVRDHVIWFKHLDSDVTLAERLSRLGAGQVIRLVVDGFAGKWAKMDDGKDGRPTPGLRPLGEAKEAWNALFNTRRGDQVSAFVASGLPEDAPWVPPSRAPDNGEGMEEASMAYGPRLRIEKADPVMKKAAIAAILDPNRLMGRSTNDVFTRDDLHDRGLDREGGT